jgi:hypothetical protein
VYAKATRPNAVLGLLTLRRVEATTTTATTATVTAVTSFAPQTIIVIIFKRLPDNKTQLLLLVRARKLILGQ